MIVLLVIASLVVRYLPLYHSTLPHPELNIPCGVNLLLPYIRLSSVLPFLQSLPCVRVFHLSLYTASFLTAIGEYAFTGCRFYSLVLPKSLRDIGFSAFTHCQDMERVVMNCTDLQIGSHAFCYCYSLYAVQLPQNISFKSSNTFEYTPYQEVFEREYGRR